jgi:hypothetical protein
LIMDSFSAHKTKRVKDMLKEHNFDLVMIPAGFTKYLQPLDLTFNRSFKSKLKDFYCKDIGIQNSTKISQYKFRIDKLSKHLKQVSHLITRTCIMNGFKKILL